MEVILLEAVGKLGQLGDTVEVKPGYARNYLIPQRKAIRATPEAVATVEQRRAQLVTEEKERLDVALARSDSAVKALTIVKRVIDEEGRLFGSVSTAEIIEAAAEQGTELLRSEIDMPGGVIKTIGDHVVSVQVHPEVSFDIAIVVVAGETEISVEELIDENPPSEATSESPSGDDGGESDSSDSPEHAPGEETGE